MAKPLVFHWDGADIPFNFEKIDRSKLYGYKELEVVDEHGGVCQVASMADDGHTIIGRGGTGFGYVSPGGNWCEKSELKPVDTDGNEIVPVTSSFSAPIELFDPVDVGDYLNHTIRSVYLLEVPDENPLVIKLRAGAIFKFLYSYRGGLESDVAFLLCNHEGHVFMAVGSPAKLEMLGLQSSPEGDEQSVDGDLDDDLDFGMI
ncbi:MAG: hypothetical protein R3C03_01730 [Pirellulaceae bacterium]